MMHELHELRHTLPGTVHARLVMRGSLADCRAVLAALLADARQIRPDDFRIVAAGELPGEADQAAYWRLQRGERVRA